MGTDARRFRNDACVDPEPSWVTVTSPHRLSAATDGSAHHLPSYRFSKILDPLHGKQRATPSSEARVDGRVNIHNLLLPISLLCTLY